MSSQHVIAVDLGGTKLLGGVVDREGVALRRSVKPTVTENQAALVAELEGLIDELMEEDVGAIGVGIPSTIDQRAGQAVASVNVPLGELAIRDWLTSRFGVPAAIENDANAAALAEHRFGAGRGFKHMIMLTLGTGIGGGMILNDELYRGAIGAAGELGHITLDVNGPLCQGICPGYGHLEVLASGTAVDDLARRNAADRPEGDLGQAAADGREVDAKLAVELAAEGPGDARALIEKVAFYLGIGISAYVNVFNPEVVVLGGGFARAGDLLFEPVRKVVAESALVPARDLVRIVPAALGVEAGLIGASLVGFEALDSPVEAEHA